jgi:hypothetical protein
MMPAVAYNEDLADRVRATHPAVRKLRKRA